MASIRNTKKLLKKIEVNHGDILLLKCGQFKMAQMFAEKLNKIFSETNKGEAITLITLNKLSDLQKATPELLKKLGLQQITEGVVNVTE